MKIKRELDITTAIYDLTGLTQMEFNQILRSLEHYDYHTRRDFTGSELLQKLREMANSSVTII